MNVFGCIVAALALLWSGAATASLCDRVVEGTCESNVCWLMETNFDEMTPRVMLFLVEAQAYEAALAVQGQTLTAEDREELRDLTVIDSVDEGRCTVTYTTLGDKNTIYFNRINPTLIDYEATDDVLKYTLRGPDFSADGRREIEFFSDGVTFRSLRRAMNNLFDKYCEGVQSEF